MGIFVEDRAYRDYFRTNLFREKRLDCRRFFGGFRLQEGKKKESPGGFPSAMLCLKLRSTHLKNLILITKRVKTCMQEKNPLLLFRYIFAEVTTLFTSCLNPLFVGGGMVGTIFVLCFSTESDLHSKIMPLYSRFKNSISIRSMFFLFVFWRGSC